MVAMRPVVFEIVDGFRRRRDLTPVSVTLAILTSLLGEETHHIASIIHRLITRQSHLHRLTMQDERLLIPHRGHHPINHVQLPVRSAPAFLEDGTIPRMLGCERSLIHAGLQRNRNSHLDGVFGAVLAAVRMLGYSEEEQVLDSEAREDAIVS